MSTFSSSSSSSRPSSSSSTSSSSSRPSTSSTSSSGPFASSVSSVTGSTNHLMMDCLLTACGLTHVTHRDWFKIMISRLGAPDLDHWQNEPWFIGPGAIVARRLIEVYARIHNYSILPFQEAVPKCMEDGVGVVMDYDHEPLDQSMWATLVSGESFAFSDGKSRFSVQLPTLRGFRCISDASLLPPYHNGSGNIISRRVALFFLSSPPPEWDATFFTDKKTAGSAGSAVSTGSLAQSLEKELRQLKNVYPCFASQNNHNVLGFHSLLPESLIHAKIMLGHLLAENASATAAAARATTTTIVTEARETTMDQVEPPEVDMATEDEPS